MTSAYLSVFLGLFLVNAVAAAELPPVDSRFNNYNEMSDALKTLASDNPKIARSFSLGRSWQGRQIWAIELTGKRDSNMPAVVFLANLRAREHLSAEVTLLLVQYLVKNYGVDQNVTRLVNERDLYFIPMANPDGAEYDIREDRYWNHVKNVRTNSARNPGVDLGSNFGYAWGASGSTSDPASDVYRGPSAFSEPETIAIGNFFKSRRTKVKLFMNLGAFGEHVLYPWSSSFSRVGKLRDQRAYVAIAKNLAAMSKYSHSQASEQFIASGDVMDWVYSAFGTLSFTVRLSPSDVWSGGYYPSAAIIDKVFEGNLKSFLYFIELADNPYKTL